MKDTYSAQLYHKAQFNQPQHKVLYNHLLDKDDDMRYTFITRFLKMLEFDDVDNSPTVNEFSKVIDFINDIGDNNLIIIVNSWNKNTFSNSKIINDVNYYTIVLSSKFYNNTIINYMYAEIARECISLSHYEEVKDITLRITSNNKCITDEDAIKIAFDYSQTIESIYLEKMIVESLFLMYWYPDAYYNDSYKSYLSYRTEDGLNKYLTYKNIATIPVNVTINELCSDISTNEYMRTILIHFKLKCEDQISKLPAS